MQEKFFIELVFHFIDYSYELDDNVGIETLDRKYYNYYETLVEAVEKLKQLITTNRVVEEIMDYKALDIHPDYAYVRVYDTNNKTIYKKTFKFDCN
jgi:hypothetical protein